MTTAAGLERRRLGSSDLDVSAIGLGGNTFGPPRLDERETRRFVYVALDLGVNFVDTAIVYGRGRSEEFLGRTLGRRRDEVVIATKFNLAALAGDSVADPIAAHAEESLRKLRTDRIDLYQLLLANPLVGSVITGVSNPARFKANVAAANWRLTPEETSAVDAIVSGPAGPPDPERPPSGRRP